LVNACRQRLYCIRQRQRIADRRRWQTRLLVVYGERPASLLCSGLACVCAVWVHGESLDKSGVGAGHTVAAVRRFTRQAQVATPPAMPCASKRRIVGLVMIWPRLGHRALWIAIGVAGLFILFVSVRVATAADGETLTVLNTATKPVESKTVLVADHEYEVVVQGTVSDWCSATGCPAGDPNTTPQPFVGQDALYGYAAWRFPTPQITRQLLVDGVGLDQFAGQAGKIAYNPTHVYRVVVMGITGALSFISADTSSAYNNSGAWTVRITDLGPTSTTTTKPPPAQKSLIGKWAWVLIERTRYVSTDPGITATLATEPILEWPAESPLFITKRADHQVRLRATITGAPLGTNFTLRISRACSNPSAATVVTATAQYTLVAKAGRPVLLPPVAISTHNGVSCAWRIRTSSQRKTMTISLEAFDIVVGNPAEPVLSLADLTPYEAQVCTLTLNGSEHSQHCVAP
jgi:hypothetical protein